MAGHEYSTESYCVHVLFLSHSLGHGYPSPLTRPSSHPRWLFFRPAILYLVVEKTLYSLVYFMQCMCVCTCALAVVVCSSRSPFCCRRASATYSRLCCLIPLLPSSSFPIRPSVSWLTWVLRSRVYLQWCGACRGDIAPLPSSPTPSPCPLPSPPLCCFASFFSLSSSS